MKEVEKKKFSRKQGADRTLEHRTNLFFQRKLRHKVMNFNVGSL